MMANSAWLSTDWDRASCPWCEGGEGEELLRAVVFLQKSLFCIQIPVVFHPFAKKNFQTIGEVGSVA